MFGKQKMSIMALAMAGISGLATRYSQSDMRATGPEYRNPRPAGGLRLVEVPEDRLEAYLGGRRRDTRSFPVSTKYGTERGFLRYFTHVNYSRIYKMAMPGQRECRRRRPAYYVEVTVS